MRLIGGHDYYDNALAFGQDTDVVFVRHKNKTFKSDESTPLKFINRSIYFRKVKGCPEFDWYSFGGQNGHPYTQCAKVKLNNIWFVIDPVVVWFCGKRYGGLRVSCDVFQMFFWSLAEFETWAASHLLFLDVKRTHWQTSDNFYKSLTKFFYDQGTPEDMEWMITNRITTAVWLRGFNKNIDDRKTSQEWFENIEWKIDSDDLGLIQFYKVIDPYTAFQEISMWVGGILPKDGNPMVEITDDNIKAAKHGMDRWSFKTPGKKGMY